MPNPDDLSDDDLLALARNIGAAAHVAADETVDPEIRAVAESALEKLTDPLGSSSSPGTSSP